MTNESHLFKRRTTNNVTEQTQHKENWDVEHEPYSPKKRRQPNSVCGFFCRYLWKKVFFVKWATVRNVGLAYFLLFAFRTYQVSNKNRNKNSSYRYMIPPFNQDTLNGGNVNSAPGVTGPGIPSLMKQILQETGKEIDETLETSFAAEDAVNVLEGKCKWVPEETNFQDKACFEKVNFDATHETFHADPSIIDIVTPSIRNLNFLNQWREFFQGFHVIIIQDGDPYAHLEIPEWVDYELYNRHDIESALGDEAWIISSKDASIRNFGFLVSKKPYIYTIDDDCLPALDMKGYVINPIAAHLQNLLTPANPYFFNTLYDPYATNSDFVRGYPYSLREGVKTAVSHGLWMFTPDYDATTQLLKPLERNSNYLDMALTIPFKTLYPMCSMNVAFSRELIGPAFMQGLMGEGQPWARYDDMFAGWASKVVADHLGFGVKSGKPYIYHNKLSNPFTNLKKEYQGLFWQEDIIRFFANEVEFSTDADTPNKAYVELADQIRARFSSLHPYFDRLATSMVLWTEIWDKVSTGTIQSIPSRIADPSVREQFLPINLSTKGAPRMNEMALMKIFPTSFPSRNMVTANDIEIGHAFKTFLVPLDVKFHEGAIDNIMTKYFSNRKKYPENFYYKDGDKLPKLQTDYYAEAIILKKLLVALDFVQNVEDADLILVPALPTIACRWPLKSCSEGSKHIQWQQNLDSQIKTFAPKEKTFGKKFLYLATEDTGMIHGWNEGGRFSDPNNFVVTFGPAIKENVIVVPSLNLMKELQPSHWEDCQPIKERKVFLSANFGTRNWLKDRITISKELDAYNGTKTISRDFFVRGRKDLADSLFVISAPGDLPYQKRFFDAILQCAIPVVVSREVEGIGKTYWSNVFFARAPQKPVRIDQSYPSLPFGVSYSDFVFEVDGKVIEEGGLMTYLESIKKEEIELKLRNISKFRNRFVYDLDGSSEDAFSIMLRELTLKFK